MLNDYKGEQPTNVITKEQHEKRPFYKKVSFWVLSALGLFFGGCSVYGLVLGYQYVHAVTEAAHIIADAQSSDGESLSKNKHFLPSPFPYDDFSFSFRNEGGFQGTKVFRIDTGAEVDTSNMPVYVPCFRINCSSSSSVVLCYPFATSNNTQNLCLEDYITPFTHNQAGWQTIGFYHYCPLIDSSNPFVCSGTYHFKPYEAGHSAGEEVGYQNGYEEGKQDGYQEGYDDGYQALAGVQNVRILFDENFPTLNPINYSWKVDGQDVASGQIMLRPNQSAPVVNLTRPGGYTHKATLNIWSENDEPLVIAYGRHEGLVIGGTQTYIYDTYNKSNAYDWANSIWYVPTYNPTTGFVIYSYATAQQGYTNDYFFEFDPEHNDRAKTGIYADGYKQGYDDGTSSGTAYDNGHADGYSEGYEDGKTIGIAQGESQAVGGQKALVTMFVTAFQQPFDQIYRFLNFNVLGLNILALFTALLTLSIGIVIIKKVI